MTAKTNRIFVFLPFLVGAAAGAAVRLWQLRSAFDGDGLVISGSPSTWVLGILCAALTVLALILARRLTPRSGYEESFSSETPEMILSLVAAALLLAGCCLELLSSPGGLNLLVQFLGIASALCIGVVARQRYMGVVPKTVFHLLPCLYLVVRLIVDFKQWSVDPAVLDYCYTLFASISAMCAVFHLGGFCFSQGRRRTTVFWCLLCVVFSAVSMADGGLSRCLLTGGLGLWAGVNGWELLEEP